MNPPPRVKICCIASTEEAQAAIQAGASALGLVSEMPSGPGPISWEAIAQIAARIPPPVAAFLLTCAQDADRIIAQQRRVGVGVLQLVDCLEHSSEYTRIRAALPGIRIVQVIHVIGEASYAEAVAVAPNVDALLLDSGNPSLVVKELGGTGRTHGWTISRRIRDSVPVPVFLAGGLTAENVAEAVRVVKPFGLDVCTGVRTNNKLDTAKLARFFAAVESISMTTAA